MSADLTVPPRLIEELERGAIDCVNLHYPGWGNTMGAAAVAIASLQARLDAAERDAARYRIVRRLGFSWHGFIRGTDLDAELDVAIADAATQEKP